MKKLAVVLFAAWLTFAGLMLYANGNLLVLAESEPYQVCLGRSDNKVPSWWCTPDYTAKQVDYQAELAMCGENLYHTMGALKSALERLDND